MKRAGILTASAMLAALALPVEAADRTEIVKFKPGAISTTVKSSVKGYDTVNYLFDARAGQVISVLFSPSNGSCYFTAWAPDADEATFDGTINGNEYADNLKVTGTQKVMVFLMRNAARRNETCKYQLTIEISG